MNLEWNVLYYNSNAKRIEWFNVFQHNSFNKAVKEIFNKQVWLSLDEFEDAIDKEAMYYFWRKAEYEIMISDWIGEKTKAKIDIYSQLKLNWNRFIDYLWNEYQNRNKREG